MKLRITTPVNNGRFIHGSRANVFLDDVDVSIYVTRVVLDVDADGPITAAVTFGFSEVDIDLPAVIEPLISEAEVIPVMGDNATKHRRVATAT